MFPIPPVLTCPPPAETGITVDLIETGTVPGDWKQVVDTGARGPVELPVWVGVVRHPTQGVTLVDAGLGEQNRSGDQPGFPLRRFPRKVPEGATAIEQLGNIPDRVLLTHIHYNHVGGPFDMPGTEVWVTEADWQAGATERSGFPVRSLSNTVRFHRVSLEANGARMVLGRPAVDVLGDGTIWYLSLPGHTPGPTGVLVRAEGDPWRFVGDTAWGDAQLDDARRLWLTTHLTDTNPRDLRESLDWACERKRSCSNLHIVTGHQPAG